MSSGSDCVVCGKSGVGRCVKCRRAVYCSSACQHRAWHAGHAQECCEPDNGRAPLLAWRDMARRLLDDERSVDPQRALDGMNELYRRLYAQRIGDTDAPAVPGCEDTDDNAPYWFARYVCTATAVIDEFGGDEHAVVADAYVERYGLDRINVELGDGRRVHAFVARLDLSGKQLSRVPAGLERLQVLETLVLNNNNISALPDSLFALRTLRVLDVSENAIAELPATIGDARMLEELDVSHNGLRRVPDSLATIETLRVLDLSHNGLEAVPEQLVHRDLDVLDLSDTRLHALPDELGTTARIGSLSLDFVPLTRLPLLAQVQNLSLQGAPADFDWSTLPRQFERISERQTEFTS